MDLVFALFLTVQGILFYFFAAEIQEEMAARSSWTTLSPRAWRRSRAYLITLRGVEIGLAVGGLLMSLEALLR